MGFIDSYKHLEKLCGEIMDDDRRVTAYIEEMENTSNGHRYVPSWYEDLTNLKNYRHIRNLIAHEPNYSEENMCTPDDVKWLDNFYDRIMNRTDPLALYRKAISLQKQQSKPKPQPTGNDHEQKAYEKDYNPPKNDHIGIGLFVAATALLAVLIWFISKL